MSETTNRPLKVFLCHASQDKPVVRELYSQLKAIDWIDPWLDDEKLIPGQDWEMEIEKAVETADAVIVCMSNNSVTKVGSVQKELRFVLDISDLKPDEAIFVIPIRLDDCLIPIRLKKRQYVDYFPFDKRNHAYERVLQALRARREGLDVIPTGNMYRSLRVPAEEMLLKRGFEDKYKETMENAIQEMKRERQSALYLRLLSDFSMLATTIAYIKPRPWLLRIVPNLFHKYSESIEAAKREDMIDEESIILHSSLLYFYQGKLRFKLWGWLGIVVHPLAEWILEQFDIARSTIEGAKGSPIHTYIDILAYRAVAKSRFGKCLQAREDIPGIRILLAGLLDEVRTQYWEKQFQEIERHCGRD